jgi:hypothetical protein
MGARIQIRSTFFFAFLAVFVLAAAQPELTHASNWKQLFPAISPSVRSYCAMAYDPVSKKVVLFGGLGASGNLNDTWTFDGTNWAQVNTAVAPPVRNGATMAFDRTTRKLVMFGGFDTDHYLQDTWLWDGATSTWTQAQLTKSPPGATGVMMFTDPLSGHAMMFGGYNIFKPLFPVFNNTWQWTGTSWNKLHPSTVPYPRAWGTATLNSVRRMVVLTGGNGDTIRTDNTWTWDGTDWTLQSPATQVEAFIGAGSAFVPGAQAVVLFGGIAETWSWNGTTWVQLVPLNSPSAREGVGMTYDPATHQVIIFGGLIANGPLTNETWQLVGH